MKRRWKMLFSALSVSLLVLAGLAWGSSSLSNRKLHDAVLRGDFVQVRKWLHYGGSVNAINHRGESLLHSAVRSGREEVALELLAQGADPHACNQHQQTPLLLAVLVGNSKLTQAIIDAGASVEPIRTQGPAPLLMAVEFGNREIVTQLLAAGANVQVQGGRFEGTPLHSAAARGDKAMIELLLQHGAQIDAVDILGRQPAHLAAARNAQALELLLDHGAELEPLTYASTPLAMAAQHGRLEALKLLLARGANPDCVPRGGQSALVAAVNAGNVSIVKLLLRPGDGAQFGQALFSATRSNNLPLVELLLAEGADPLQREQDNSSLLHIAAEQGNVSLLQRLVAAGVDINAQADNGATALHMAARSGQTNAVRFLLEQGADVQLGQGQLIGTPLHALMRGAVSNTNQSSTHLSVLELLLTTQIDVNAIDHGNDTALRIAVERELEPYAQRLTARGAQLWGVDSVPR